MAESWARIVESQLLLSETKSQILLAEMSQKSVTSSLETGRMPKPPNDRENIGVVNTSKDAKSESLCG